MAECGHRVGLDEKLKAFKDEISGARIVVLDGAQQSPHEEMVGWRLDNP